MSLRDKWVRRFSVDETLKHKGGFTIYKITSVLFPLDSPEAVTVISVWKRYSDIQQLHKCMSALHAGLHLKGTFPSLAKSSYFKRFQQEVIDERVKSIKLLLEFIAEHSLLFTSTDFVNFLQSGYPEPECSSVINAIRSSLRLPIEDTPPLEYQDEDTPTAQGMQSPINMSKTDIQAEISQIPIYEAADVELRLSPVLPKANSFESLSSLESISSDLYDELSKISVQDVKPCVKVLPDLINFEIPSTSKMKDYHSVLSLSCTNDGQEGKNERETYKVSKNQTLSNFDLRNDCIADKSISNTLNRSLTDDCADTSNVSETVKREELDRYVDSTLRKSFSLSNTLTGSESEDVCDGQTLRECQSVCNSIIKTECSSSDVTSRRVSMSSSVSGKDTEDRYVFEAGYLLNLASRCEDLGDYKKAFDCYKSAIEKMLIGVQSDRDPERRSLIKQKTNTYLAYAEQIYDKHLNGASLETNEVYERVVVSSGGVPACMLRRPYEQLAQYRVLTVLSGRLMLVHSSEDHDTLAMKVIQKIPQNLTEFDDYFQKAPDTKQPVLPTNIPYMVPLQAYIETEHLIFLILSYAPGGKLFDYIKNYARSIPTTPAKVNLENVFRKTDNELVDGNRNKTELTVNELVVNSQKLLQNVDKALGDREDDIENNKGERDNEVEKEISNVIMSRPRDVIPPSTVRKWGAEILTAIESLHNCGVVCRDLNPSNILLGEGGQIILTYFYYYPDVAVSVSSPHRAYIAPELFARPLDSAVDDRLRHVCDFWSFGAILYELICGVPLSEHNPTFTSHSLLQLPEHLSLEVETLLTQLLTFEPAERLGAGPGGIAEIKQHPYFQHIDWTHVYNSWLVPD
ncbi:ribosomal protein S6 kinase delta-1 [Leptidea sinapis]|uniref:ribosomal protein S6 kinase delta-1 n=1 Tax=Leptidea sinapis TaxID=189913 RepID=UPI0021247545|nr:ribosomal protein S6 kinase delta-1 [Leptidea sinapis]